MRRRPTLNFHKGLVSNLPMSLMTTYFFINRGEYRCNSERNKSEFYWTIPQTLN